MQKGNESSILSKAIIIAAIILLIRLFFLQIVNSDYKLEAQNNVVKKQIIYPSRGLIVDKKGKIMVYNDVVYDILIDLSKTKKITIDTAQLAFLLGSDMPFMRKKLDEIKRTTPNKPTALIKLLDQETFSKFQEHLYNFPYITIQARTVRRYPFHGGAALFGYLSEVTENNITQSKGYYELGDYMGTTGLESYYDSYLRGDKGINYQIFDVHNSYKGKYKKGKDDKLPTAGWDMITSIDAELQTFGEKLMQNKVGGIVAIDPATGEILAYISSPTYDPNILTGRYRRHNFNILFKDNYKPLLNRPIQALYPPGSTFKPAVGLVMMQKNIHAYNWHWFCPGGYRVGNHLLKCHGSHGIDNIETALQHSCNSYFCKVFNDYVMDSTFSSVEAGYKDWWNAMAKFGYGHKLGIDLNGEKKGNLPSADYYNKAFGKNNWKASRVISIAIGQGEVLATPLQMANATAIVANRGYYITPKICKYLTNGKKYLAPKKQKYFTGIDTFFYNKTVDGMEKVVLAGTAKSAKIEGITICGKTGTAQNPHGKDHSIFVAFAPKDHPKIAIAVFVENAGFGATYAAPIASLMIEKYINDTISKKRKPVEERMTKAVLIKREIVLDSNQIKALKVKQDSIKKVKEKLKQDSIKNGLKPKVNKIIPKKDKNNTNNNPSTNIQNIIIPKKDEE